MTTMNPVILFRGALAEEGELEVVKKHFKVIESRSEVARLKRQALVIPRYSALPYYDELEKDVELLGGKLINSYREHLYVADINRWYWDFEDLTPKTWMRVADVPWDEEGPFVLKGATNSRKHRWKTHMYAPDRQSIMKILDRLTDDSFIMDQGIVARQFEYFMSYGKAINDLPITEEHRFFCLDGEILATGFYWSEHKEEAGGGRVEPEGISFVKEEILPRLQDKIRFVVVDIALREDNIWRLVELNDGGMSGLSCVDPHLLYENMARALRGNPA